MVLLENDQFLSEMTKMYERNREKGSVWTTMKSSLCSMDILTCTFGRWQAGPHQPCHEYQGARVASRVSAASLMPAGPPRR